MEFASKENEQRHLVIPVDDDEEEAEDDFHDRIRSAEREMIDRAVEKDLDIHFDRHAQLVLVRPTPDLRQRVAGTAKGLAGGALAGAVVGTVVCVTLVTGGTAVAAGLGAASAASSAGATSVGAILGAAVEAGTAVAFPAHVSARIGLILGSVSGGVGGGVRGWTVAGQEDLDAFFEGCVGGACVAGAVVTLASKIMLQDQIGKYYKKGEAHHAQVKLGEKVTMLTLDQADKIRSEVIGQEIGKGREKIVRDVGNNQVIVLRNLTSGGIRRDDADAIEREGNKMRRLKGVEGIAQIDGWAKIRGVMGFIMPKYDGSAQDLNLLKKLSKSQLCLAFKNAAEGVKNLHEKGYAHFDLSPDNLFFENSKLVVGDLGGAKSMNSDGKAMPEICKHDYAAPEIQDGGYVDGRKCDAFSFGKCLRFCVANGPMFVNASQVMISLIQKLTKVDPEQRLTIEEALQIWPGAMYW